MSSEKKFKDMNLSELEGYVIDTLDFEDMRGKNTSYSVGNPTPAITLLTVAMLAVIKSNKGLDRLTRVLIGITIVLGILAVIQIILLVK